MQLSATALEKPESRAMPWRRPLACIVFTLLLQGLVAIVLIALYASQPQQGALRVAAAQELPDPDLTHIDDEAWQALELHRQKRSADGTYYWRDRCDPDCRGKKPNLQ